MRIPSGVTDQGLFFVAVDATDFTSRETGLNTFTVYRCRDVGAAAAYTTPSVTEVDATNMPGVYRLLLDEDMTIGAGNDSEEVCLHITHSGMAPVTRTFELYRAKITAGDTLSTASGLITDIGTNAKASVNAEVLDVLNTDTFAEPTGVPAASDTLAEKIGVLYMMARNKVTVTSTKKTFFDDGDAAEFEQDLSDDGTTYTQSECNAI